jgi:hypothetical protein
MSQPTAIDVLKRAAEIVEASWAPGATNATDAHGRALPLFSDLTSETGRATLNKEAVAFSIYGAMVKATGEVGIGIPHTVWLVLNEVARNKGCRGGIVAYNAMDGVTAADAKALILQAVDIYEKLLASGATEPDPVVLREPSNG